MNKAFVREPEGDEDEQERDDALPELPPGQKNYMTPAGVKRMQEELYRLKHVERPEVTKVVSWAAENGDRSENADYHYGKRKLREIDRRIRYLGKRLDNVDIVEPHTDGTEIVYFGATVTIVDLDDEEEPPIQKTYSIVGIDETDLDHGRISWISPLATALLRARLGDVVTFRTPKGLKEVEIVAVKYLPL